MPVRIPKYKILGIVRKGLRVVPEIGAEFDFTSEEITEINAANPEALDQRDIDHEATTAPKLTEAEKAEAEKAEAEKAKAEKAKAL